MTRLLTILLFTLASIPIACQGDRKQVDAAGPEMTGDSLAVAITERLAADPENPALYQERALRYLAIKQVEPALGDIRTAIRLAPDEPGYQVTLSDIYFSLGRARECKQTLESVTQSFPQYIDAWLKLAELQFYFKRYPDAENCLLRAEELDKREPRIHFMRGFIAKEKGDTAGAVRHYMRTLEYDPVHFDACIQLGILYAAKSDPLALQFYQNALNIRPNSIEALYNMAMYHQEQDELNQALELYHRILGIDPSYKYALFNLGYIHIELKVWSEAVGYFNKAVNADPQYVEGYYGRAFSFEQMGDVLKATEDYRRCLQLKPDYFPAQEGLMRIQQNNQSLPAPQAGTEQKE